MDSGMEIVMDYIKAFVVGGLICVVVQILMEKTKLMPGRIMVLLVCTGAVRGGGPRFRFPGFEKYWGRVLRKLLTSKAFSVYLRVVSRRERSAYQVH